MAFATLNLFILHPAISEFSSFCLEDLTDIWRCYASWRLTVRISKIPATIVSSVLAAFITVCDHLQKSFVSMYCSLSAFNSVYFQGSLGLWSLAFLLVQKITSFVSNPPLSVNKGRTFRRRLLDKAERSAIDCFAKNVRELLLTAPLKGHPVLAIDPGYSNGCKCALVAANGWLFLYNFAVFLQKTLGLQSLYIRISFHCLSV